MKNSIFLNCIFQGQWRGHAEGEVMLQKFLKDTQVDPDGPVEVLVKVMLEDFTVKV
jgi:hypothetical protein